MTKKKKETNKKVQQNIVMTQMILGILMFFSGFIFVCSFISYLFNWKSDQSQLGHWQDKTMEVGNIFGKMGAWFGELFIYKGIGAIAILLAVWLMIMGVRIILKLHNFSILKLTFHFLFFMLWTPILLAFVLPQNPIWGGRMGFEVTSFLQNMVHSLGIILLLLLTFVLYAVIEWRITPDKVANKIKGEKQKLEDNLKARVQEVKEEVNITSKSKSSKENEDKKAAIQSAEKDYQPISELDTETGDDGIDFEVKEKEVQSSDVAPLENEKPEQKMESPADEIPFTAETAAEEETVEVPEVEIKEIIIEPDETSDLELTVETHQEKEVEVPEVEITSEHLVDQIGEYDPRLDLHNFKFPTINLLKDYNEQQNVNINQQELEANKNKILETLLNYGVKISSIKATIGPTVTLYEIVPEAGVRISKIKNLEDDIALSLSALGIRIIAPIPGKGTIGIEVPNTNPSIVSMRSVIASQKFQNAKKMELPIAFGKTISNETFVADLAKMPHLLMAGATGQGKSVGLNALITSLLYKKHPAELKFVMVDPKKVELALYNKITRHYLAKLPDSEEAIITDNQKVINTLNSLCIEMDDRYELLKNAYVRNIKEYNQKFKNRKLNPERGHRFLPYIVLVVDEFADLIMTAGKEVEAPIARLAQLARAVGIHLIIATQRPSVNVITGIIKANFPARAAFRVTSKIDSRTILDGAGADQLIGRGDMLYTTGNDMVRLQCAFVDTPEVENIAEFIGEQKGYPDAFLLPEYVGDDGGGALDIDPSDRDALFEDAARVIVQAQQGSASLLQRKLKIGYNRAGRLIDQLEANGIVGPFEGSKAREVLIIDEMSLEQILKNG